MRAVWLAVKNQFEDRTGVIGSHSWDWVNFTLWKKTNMEVFKGTASATATMVECTSQHIHVYSNLQPALPTHNPTTTTASTNYASESMMPLA
jgi:hypothetical protein